MIVITSRDYPKMASEIYEAPKPLQGRLLSENQLATMHLA